MERYSVISTHTLIKIKGLNFFTASLALVSTMIGAGIVGVPYGYQKTGFILGFIINFFLMILTCFSCYLYLLCKDLTGGLDSFSEIGYKLFKRPAIFVINTMIVLLCFGGLVAYYNIFGVICAQLYKNLSDNSDNVLAHEWFYILIVGGLSLYPIFKKEIKELKFISIVLFVSVIIFLIAFTLLMATEGTKHNPDPSPSVYYEFHFDKYMSQALSIFIYSYCFQPNIFATYASLHKKTNQEAIKAFGLTLIMSQLIYMPVTFFSIYMFGSKIEDDFFKNFEHIPNPTWESYLLRSAFIIVIGCHIPYVLFIGKQSLLSMIDEVTRQTISSELKERFLQKIGDETADDKYVAEELMHFNGMNPFIYYSASLIFLGLNLIGAIFIPNLSIVFTFVGSFVMSFVCFIWPGVFYLVARAKFQKKDVDDKPQRIIAYILTTFGILVMGFVIVTTALPDKK